ncbi:MAG TPA: family 43 glycosylhydrolase [Microbacterium sp.]|uniref:family 43 glycosylhydrolase n=1 Tax=Microbacterium sp. TaxID=51671 RepID=UPI002B4853C6|nr:family 43 glycosylhydrolase [Microbacterium sp.]HKT57112.1 family 43 glycosylhydrolase [Microbacterium sp.]
MTSTDAPAPHIRPGTVFTDTAGRTAQLHGIGIQRVDGRFYAWGEDKRAGSTFTAVACYSSPDLVSWTFEGNALEAGDGDLGADRVIERPKVLRRPDGRFVLFLHVDTADYAAARVGYAIADSPAGPFTYVGSERPLGNASRDIGVFQEGGVGYLLSEDRENGLHIYRLADDYLSVVAVVATTLKAGAAHGYESPALVRHEGRYYLFGSDLTGWSTNDNKVATASELGGPWSAWSDFAPPGSATFDSQVSAVIRLDDAGDDYLYIGDRWRREDLFASPAVWLPLRIGDGRAELRWEDQWRPVIGA